MAAARRQGQRVRGGEGQVPPISRDGRARHGAEDALRVHMHKGADCENAKMLSICWRTLAARRASWSGWWHLC